MRTVAIISNKGGTSKTTTTINLAYSLAAKGKKVLMIDLDSQANLSLAEGIVQPEAHVGQVLLKEIPIEQAIVRKTVDVLPSTQELTKYEIQLMAQPKRETRLHKALSTLKGYDFVIIDTPPALGTLTDNALTAADEYIITVNADYFSYEGIRHIINHVKEIEVDAELSGILLTKFNEKQRARVIKLFAERMKSSSYRVYETSIRQCARVIESQIAQQPLLEYDPEATATEDYLRFSEEFLKV